MGRTLAIAFVVSAVAGGVVGYGASVLATSPAQPPQPREFWVFTTTLPFDDSRAGFPPHDSFAPDRLTVHRGDAVTIHFLNTEEDPENHTFTMEAPYAMDHVVNPGQSVDIRFAASSAGIFAYRCRFHQPTMTGYLVVLG